MKNYNDHIIGKQYVDAVLASGSNTLTIQQRLAWLVEEALPKRLSIVFDRIADPDTWIDIDTLEVDLGHLSLEGTDETWLKQATQAYEKAIVSYLTTESVTKSANRQQMELIKYWLNHGHLPWWGDITNFDRVVQQTILKMPLTLIELLKDTQNRKRWIHYIEDEQQEGLATQLGVQLPIFITDWIQKFSKDQTTDARYWYWESIWKLYTAHHHVSKTFFLEKVTQELLAISESFLQKKAVEKNTISSDFHNNKDKVNAISDTTSDPTEENEKRSGSSQNEGEVSEISETTLRQTQEKVGKENEKRGGSSQNEEIYVPLAGIVLIHPFIETLLDRLGLIKDQQFVDSPSQSRAVYLLFYVATGRLQASEPELPLLKLLCGFAPKTLITSPSLPLTTKELDEVEKMLQAAIDHWPAIEGTTVDELRATFMMREGKLTTTHLGWQLVVEQQAFDLVFQHLPWGLSPIQFPWMDQMLWVDWA